MALFLFSIIQLLFGFFCFVLRFHQRTWKGSNHVYFLHQNIMHKILKNMKMFMINTFITSKLKQRASKKKFANVNLSLHSVHFIQFFILCSLISAVVFQFVCNCTKIFLHKINKERNLYKRKRKSTNKQTQKYVGNYTNSSTKYIVHNTHKAL